MDGWPLTQQVAYGDQMVVQGQGRFIKRGLLGVIVPVVWM